MNRLPFLLAAFLIIHATIYGNYELARCVVEGIRTNQLPLIKFFADVVKPFNPARPDAPEQFALPTSRSAIRRRSRMGIKPEPCS